MSASAHVEAERRLRVSVIGTIQRIWRGMPGYDEADVEQWLRQTLPIIEVGQRTSAQITRAYLSKALKVPPPPSDLSAYVGAALRSGTPPTEVYRRPFVTTWTALKQGAAYQDAVNAGLARAASTAAMDVQLAMRAAARDSFQAAGVETYHRIPDGDACELCLIAATNVYRVADLMPIHNGCGCSVGPGSDGALTRSAADERIAAREAEATAPDIAVHEHGELGPVLTNSSHGFTEL